MNVIPIESRVPKLSVKLMLRDIIACVSHKCRRCVEVRQWIVSRSLIRLRQPLVQATVIKRSYKLWRLLLLEICTGITRHDLINHTATSSVHSDLFTGYKLIFSASKLVALLICGGNVWNFINRTYFETVMEILINFNIYHNLSNTAIVYMLSFVWL